MMCCGQNICSMAPFPVQIVEPWSSQPLEVTDLSQFGEQALTEAEASGGRARRQAFRPFLQTPMMRSARRQASATNITSLVLTAAPHRRPMTGPWACSPRDLAAAYNNLRAAAGAAGPRHPLRNQIHRTMLHGSDAGSTAENARQMALLARAPRRQSTPLELSHGPRPRPAGVRLPGAAIRTAFSG